MTAGYSFAPMLAWARHIIPHNSNVGNFASEGTIFAALHARYRDDYHLCELTHLQIGKRSQLPPGGASDSLRITEISSALATIRTSRPVSPGSIRRYLLVTYNSFVLCTYIDPCEVTLMASIAIARKSS